MKKTEYTCDLCRKEHSADSGKSGNIYAFFFNCSVVPQAYELRRFDAPCDTHICKYCVNTILNSNGKIKE